jgi:hypothetical protein
MRDWKVIQHHNAHSWNYRLILIYPFAPTATMSDTILAAIVGAVAGIITGSIGSLFAPWANWGVEKRKLKLNYRCELIREWRRGLGELTDKAFSMDKNSTYDEHENIARRFVQSGEFASLKPHLRGEVLEFIERRKGNWIPLLIDEIGRIEKEWGLV